MLSSNNKIVLGFLVAVSVSISACTPRMLGLPTSEQQLLNEGQSTSVIANNDVISAYANLKTYMDRCVAYSSPSGYVGVKSNLDRNGPEASFLVYTNGMAYTSKIHLTPTTDGKTKISYTYKNLFGKQFNLDNLMKRYQYVAEHERLKAKPCKDKD